MPHLAVCSLSRLAAVARIHAPREMISLLARGTPVERPPGIRPDLHLFLEMDDISVPAQGLAAPGEDHIVQLIDFAGNWDRSAPLLIHCWMGISRSTAAACIVAAALDPALDETALARELRARSPTATPNARMIALADRALGRGGRLIAAIQAIGRGAQTSEGVPFVLPLEP